MDLNLEPKPENLQKKKQTAVGLAAGACLALIACCFMHSWMSPAGGIEGGLSPLSMKICYRGECESMSNKDLIAKVNEELPKKDRKSPVFWITGYMVLGLSLLGAGALAAAAITIYQGKWITTPMPLPSLALLLVFLDLIVGMVFVATNPTKGTRMQFGVDTGFWLFGVGVVLAIVSAQMLVKFKPVDPDLTF